MQQDAFFQQWNQQEISCPSLQCLIGQILIQKQILVVAKNKMSDHTSSRVNCQSI